MRRLTTGEVEDHRRRRLGKRHDQATEDNDENDNEFGSKTAENHGFLKTLCHEYRAWALSGKKRKTYCTTFEFMHVGALQWIYYLLESQSYFKDLLKAVVEGNRMMV